MCATTNASCATGNVEKVINKKGIMILILGAVKTQRECMLALLT